MLGARLGGFDLLAEDLDISLELSSYDTRVGDLAAGLFDLVLELPHRELDLFVFHAGFFKILLYFLKLLACEGEIIGDRIKLLRCLAVLQEENIDVQVLEFFSCL